VAQGLRPTLAGKAVLILPDNDEPGRKHGRDVAASLAKIAKSVRVLELPGLPDKGDVADWLEQGHTLDELTASLQPRA
jgi:putative DNA primase/helicase